MNNILKTINYLNKVDQKHWPIMYDHAMRGQSFCRIMCSHQESWWNNDLLNTSIDSNITDPLQFSENQSSFLAQDDKHADIKFAYLTTHTHLEPYYKGDTKELHFRRIVQEKMRFPSLYFFTIKHPEDCNYEYPSRYIYLFASQQNSKRTYSATNPKKGNNIINVDISKLFSYNRLDFEYEYCKLLNIFDFTPRFTSVRNFILQLLDRENSIFHDHLHRKRIIK